MQHLTHALVLTCAAALVSAQAPAGQFRARLSTVPIDLAMQKSITGKGSVSATLAGSTLTISGEFEGLTSAATFARLHRSPDKGIRGPGLHDITVTAGRAGTLSASLTLAPTEMDALKAGRLYVQLHSERAPDGNLWGWLLPEVRR
jgi:hypothetical protein